MSLPRFLGPVGLDPIPLLVHQTGSLTLVQRSSCQPPFCVHACGLQARYLQV
ncbi:hypothetical protein I79_013316 [Cricetulus griseus]|uniref:Uncharacterized protein n=1 Tax=Cricetulus griseus TaxID=10029 RepID=G3HR55_CRIGR|nr:hypothetical protein I79_013316 [Cricetulus griseus]